MSVLLKKDPINFMNGKFSVEVIESKVSERDQISFDKIFLKIEKIATEVKEGNKTYPIKFFIDSEFIKLFI